MLTEDELKRMAFLEDAERQEHEGRSWMPTAQKLELAELRRIRKAEKVYTIKDQDGLVIGHFSRREDRDAALRNHVAYGMAGEE